MSDHKKKPLSDEKKIECKILNDIFLSKKNDLKLTQRRIADDLDISPSSVNAYLLGKNALNIKVALYFSKILNIEVKAFSPRLAEEIEFLSQSKFVSQSNMEEEIAIPFLKEVELSAGKGRIGLEINNNETITFSRAKLRKHGIAVKDAICVVVHGNSMLPVLKNGAIVGVDKSKFKYTSIIDGDMYAINHDGQLRVKLIFRTPKGLRFKSYNSNEHPEEEYTFNEIKSESIIIIGRIFWVEMFF